LQVPYALTGGTSFFARSEVKDIMAYLRLLMNPDDDNAFLRIINVPRRKIGPNTLEKLGLHAQASSGSLFASITAPGLQSILGAEACERLQQFVIWLEAVRTRAQRDHAIDAVREMVDDMGYEAWLHQQASSPNVADRRMDNVNLLLDSLARSLEGAADDDTDSTQDGADALEVAIGKLILRDLLERQEEEKDDNRVQLLTLHAAKGLEFPHVFILGWEEDILPHRNSIAGEQIDEERRLAYVGITRAQRTLTLSLARRRRQYGQVNECSPSRFLEELPADDLQQEGASHHLSEEQQTQKARSALASLHSMFD
jgi:ATP-dependent DNA helicase Rep